MGPEMTGEPLSGLDVFKQESADKTNAAVAEGQHDVQMAKGAGARYLDEAKSVASKIFSTAQDLLPTSTEGQSHPQGSSTGIAAPESVKTTGKPDPGLASQESSAIGTTQQYLAPVATVQPHVERARETSERRAADVKAAVQPHIDKARETAQGYLGMGIVRGSESDAVTPPPSALSDRPLANLPLDAGEEDSSHPTTTTITGADKPKPESEIG
ncbi:hypothetical protein BU15DRAFT_40517 [Melanogaster broomeanus]|nr:hypothetical protein BU15DRAFT_40517 [Melanogaster broomeanus]